MNPLAKKLNETINNHHSSIFSMLSEKGKRMFFPTQGIIAQSAEAKKYADPSFNATIGIATDKNGAIGFESIKKFFNDLNNEEIFSYSSSLGAPKLREEWKKHILLKNPLLKGKDISNPVVFSGLTHAIDIASQMFLDREEVVLLPDQIWGNYRLMLSVKNELQLQHYSLFQDEKFNVTGLSELIEKNAGAKKVTVLLNFPNNPTGYSPTVAEVEAISKMLISHAQKGVKLLVLLDEAYFGLFFDEDVYRHSLFSLLADAHENILAIKVCGATKEFFVWGFRVGFVTFASKGASPEVLSCLEQKLGGFVRAGISNCSTSAQSILTKIISSNEYEKDFQKNYEILKSRAIEVKRVLQKSTYGEVFKPYPFNSGYFMLLRLNEKIDAEELRNKLLHEKKMGTIATAKHDLRVAFSCLEKEKTEIFFDHLYQVAKDMLP